MWPARLLCPWDFPGNNTGVGCHFLLQGIFPTQGLNPHLLWLWQIGRWILYHRATWEAQTATICYNRHLVFYRYIYMSHKYRSCINAEWPKVLHFFITDRFNMLSDLTNTLTNVYLLRHILTRYFPPHSQISQ